MTTAITRTAIRAELYNQIPGLGFTGTADSNTTTTLTDTFVFQDSTLQQGTYRGRYLYRPSLATDDRVKKIASLNPTTGVVTISGSNYADTAGGAYEVVGLLHPDELNSCIQRAQTRMYFETQVPLTLVTDGDMDTSGVSSWTNGGLLTLEKVTTAGFVYSGIRSLHTVADTNLDYAASAAITVSPNEWCYASTVTNIVTGTAQLVAYDSTNSAEIASIETGEKAWTHSYIAFQIPSTCYSLTLRLRSKLSSAEIYWSHLVLYRLEQRNRLPVPSWVDEPWKFLKLREASYLKPVNNSTSGASDDAQSRSFKDWLQPSMFSLDPLHNESNPYEVQVMRPLPRNELWISGKRPYSDLETLSTESSTTHAPANLLYAYCKDEIAKVLVKRYPADRTWQILQAEAKEEVDTETRSRTEIPNQFIRREHFGRI